MLEVANSFSRIPPFIQKLENLGIKVLYPFDRVIYKYATFDTALKIIETNRLLFSPPKNFNDPFDLTNDLIDVSYRKRTLRNWFSKVETISNRKKKDLLNEYYSKPEKIRQVINDSLTELKNVAGISCFSKSNLKSLMWSHYANKHAGVCLGFNISPFKDNFTLLQVNYVNEIKPLSFFTDRPFALLYWVFTKSSIWEYEEEVRAVFHNMNGLVEFDKDSLIEIHFGLRTSVKQRKDFCKKLKDLNYDVKKLTFMTINPNTFDLKQNDY